MFKTFDMYWDCYKSSSYLTSIDIKRPFGDSTQAQEAMDPTNTMFCGSRLIRRRFSDEAAQGDMKSWPFKVTGPEGKATIEVTFYSTAKQ